ncbi:MAG: C39 family peptidase [Chlorobia bacterium]|nr:C39 family peptidase [Fimbriimonadaceae bacterium]
MITTLLVGFAMVGNGYSQLIRLPVESVAVGKQVEIKDVRPEIAWDETIVSWNVANFESAGLKVEIQAMDTWYVLADWAGDMAKASRSSVPNQKDRVGEVRTDLLHLSKPGGSVNIRLTLTKIGSGPDPALKLLTVCFSNSVAGVPDDDTPARVGKVLEPPQKPQGPHEFGKLKYRPERVSPAFEAWFKSVKGAQYCSPASASMTLGFWAEALKRPELAVDVPDVVVGVFDEKYPGTGNWPFNTAYMGSFDKMRAYTTRLAKIRDLEMLIDAGVPVVCSVALNLLLENKKPAGGDGHLVVLVGFDKAGNPVFNDPGKQDQVRRTYNREAFRKAWGNSGRTIYICHPESVKLPKLSEASVLVD